MTSFRNIRCDYCKRVCSFAYSDDMSVRLVIVSCRCGNQMVIGDITMIHPSLLKHAKKLEDVITESGNADGLTEEQRERMKSWV